MKFKIAVLPGDGIGEEVIRQGLKVLDTIADKFGHSFEYNYADIGAVAIDKAGDPLPDETIEVCRASDAIFLGAVGDPKYDNDPESKIRPEQGLLKLRNLDLYQFIYFYTCSMI